MVRAPQGESSSRKSSPPLHATRAHRGTGQRQKESQDEQGRLPALPGSPPRHDKASSDSGNRPGGPRTGPGQPDKPGQGFPGRRARGKGPGDAVLSTQRDRPRGGQGAEAALPWHELQGLDWRLHHHRITVILSQQESSKLPAGPEELDTPASVLEQPLCFSLLRKLGQPGTHRRATIRG